MIENDLVPVETGGLNRDRRAVEELHRQRIHPSHRSAVEARQAHNLEDLGSKPSDAFFVPAV